MAVAGATVGGGWLVEREPSVWELRPHKAQREGLRV